MNDRRLAVDDADLDRCVSCGLCLPHCPTFRVTGDEAASPRGRIAAMRAVQEGAPLDGRFREVIDACVGCRGCETACPSGVPFGRLLEGTRRTLAADAGAAARWSSRIVYGLLDRPRLLRAATAVVAVAQRARLVPARFGLPRLAVRSAPLRSSGTDAWLHVGCVMDAWFRDTHRSVQRLAEATGAGVAVAPPGCCGALALHAGLHDQAARSARRTIASMPGDAPVLVDAAGCGAAMREYGHLLGDDEGRRFAERVVDVHSWLAARTDRLPTTPRPLPVTVAVQDPCHLRHAQRAHLPVRAVLAPYVERLVELDDEGLCCGAGGAYAAGQPVLAGAIRARKAAAVARSGATVVASANPGCVMHLRAAGLDARHPADIIVAALGAPREEA